MTTTEVDNGRMTAVECDIRGDKARSAAEANDVGPTRPGRNRFKAKRTYADANRAKTASSSSPMKQATGHRRTNTKSFPNKCRWLAGPIRSPSFSPVVRSVSERRSSCPSMSPARFSTWATASESYAVHSHAAKSRIKAARTFAVFQANVDAASNNRTQMRLEVEGPLVVDVATCRAQRISLLGPIGMSETARQLQHGLPDDRHRPLANEHRVYLSRCTE